MPQVGQAEECPCPGQGQPESLGNPQSEARWRPGEAEEGPFEGGWSASESHH